MPAARHDMLRNDVLRNDVPALPEMMQPPAAAIVPQGTHHLPTGQHHTARSAVHHSPKGGSEMFDFLTRKAKDAVPPTLPEGTVRRRYSIEGQVQGVGFRYRARYAAQTLELTGWVENEDDGSVTLEVQGDPDKFMRLFAMIQKSDYIRITGIRQKDLPPDPWERGFSVRGY